MPCKIPFFPNGNFKSRKEHDDNGRKKWYVVDDIGLFTFEADALALTPDYHIFTTRFKALLYWDADCARRHTHSDNDVVPDSEPNSDDNADTPEGDNEELNTPSRPIASHTPTRSISSASPAPATLRSTSVKQSVKREASVKAERVSVKPERVSVKRELKREVSLPSPKRSLYADDSDDSDDADDADAVERHKDGGKDVNPMLTVYEDEDPAARRKRPVPPVSRGGQAKRPRPSPSRSPPRAAAASRVASHGPTPTAPIDISPSVGTNSPTSLTRHLLPVMVPDPRSPAHPQSHPHSPRAPPARPFHAARAATTAPHTGAPAGSAPRGGAPRRAASAIPGGERMHPDESASRAPAARHSKAPSASMSASTSGAASQVQAPGSPSERLLFNKSTQTLYKTVEQAVREMGPAEAVRLVGMDEVSAYMSGRSKKL
ncbi:hypothetical protein C8R43DRAFT_1128941 [Mycena crocata]|nr:hypothetical protein C8R43DRAFT_1128941 [Mycena crocata]